MVVRGHLETPSIGEKMKFGFGVEISPEVLHVEPTIHRLEDCLVRYFIGRNYGRDVLEVVIGVNLLSSETSAIFPLRSPFLLKGKKIVEKEGFSFELEDTLEFDIKPSYRVISSATKQSEILRAVEAALLDQAPALLALEIDDFDCGRFLNDAVKAIQLLIDEAEQKG